MHVYIRCSEQNINEYLQLVGYLTSYLIVIQRGCIFITPGQSDVIFGWNSGRTISTGAVRLQAIT